MMKTEVSINGQDYSWKGADLYSKSSTQPIWKKLKTYDSNIISISPSNNGLQIETENEIMQTDVMGTTRMIISRKQKRKVERQIIDFL